MTQHQQKLKEKKIVELFCDHLELPYGTIDDTCEKPDIRVNINYKRIGIEVTEHFNDVRKDTKNGSQGRRFLGFWEKVNEKCKELKKARGLDNISVFVLLNKRKLEKSRDSQKVDVFAEQLVEFVHNKAAYISTIGKSCSKDFERYDFLAEYVKSIHINECNAGEWFANVSACSMSISQSKLAHIIRQKNNKAAKYNSDNIDEIWLLIAAPHDNSFNSMRVPHDQIDYCVDFHGPKIINACESTPFKRIYFFAHRPDDRSESWYRLIWPREQRIK